MDFSKSGAKRLWKPVNDFIETVLILILIASDHLRNPHEVWKKFRIKILKKKTHKEIWEGHLKRERWLREQASKARKEWLEKYEHLNRFSDGYPVDWQWRRLEVYRRAGSKCQFCDNSIGKIERYFVWQICRVVEKLVGAHVHHKIKISNGGNHSLENLELLCEECHKNMHPEKAHFL